MILRTKKECKSEMLKIPKRPKAECRGMEPNPSKDRAMHEVKIPTSTEVLADNRGISGLVHMQDISTSLHQFETWHKDQIYIQHSY